MQIDHHGAMASSKITGVQPVSASTVFCRATGETPRELGLTEIPQVIDLYAEAARRAKVAGIDAVEIHAATGYLISQFLSSRTNKRSDQYGGNLRNRARFCLEVVEAVRAKVGPDYPLLIRISADEFVPGGFNLEESKELAGWLVEAGIDAIDVTAGGWETTVPVVPFLVLQGGLCLHGAGDQGKG